MVIVRITFFLFLIWVSLPALGQPKSGTNAASFEMTFNRIMGDLDSVISNSKNQNETVVSHYRFVRDKIYKGELSVVFDKSLTYDFFGCAAFSFASDNSGEAFLTFGPFVVDKYEKYPVLTYGILIHTFQSAYDYYTNRKSFLVAVDNQIEKVYFEMDAIMLEALFLNVVHEYV